MEGEDLVYIPIRDRQEWAGFIPLPSLPASALVVAIQSDPEHADLLSYFWAAMRLNELSQRVLDLSEEIILGFNSAHFSVWAWRWKCLVSLQKLQSTEGIRYEINLMRRVAIDNPKNYQLWNHRRKLALLRGPEHADEEFEFSAVCLAYDAKNYHAWAHRQAMLSELVCKSSPLSFWCGEFEFTKKLLSEDVRNNAAWNQRFFLIKECPDAVHDVIGDAHDIYDREIDFVCSKIQLAMHNEAAWVYLRALAMLAPGAPPASLAFEPRIKSICYEALEDDPSNVAATETLAERYIQRLSFCRASSQLDHMMDDASEGAEFMLNRLVIAHPCRSSYYMKKLQDIQYINTQRE